MKLKALGVFKSKFFKFKLKPCRKPLLLFKLRLKKLVFIRRAFQNLFKPKPKSKSKSKPIMSPSSPSFLSFLFRSPKKSSGSPSMNNNNNNVILGESKKIYGREEEEELEVEEACRRFEMYLVEMIVEEGKTMELMDVEELLHCWKKLKSPVFIDLVSRFYGELCRDLFSNSHSH